MTGNQLLTNACALFGELSPENYQKAALPCLNAVLFELFEVNNHIRQSEGLEKQSGVAAVASLEAELPTQPRLDGAMAWGLAAKLFIDERDAAGLSALFQQYVNAANDADTGWARWLL